jgi:hypothetical protein
VVKLGVAGGGVQGMVDDRAKEARFRVAKGKEKEEIWIRG